MLKKLHPESADKSENRDVVNGNSVICRLRYYNKFNGFYHRFSPISEMLDAAIFLYIFKAM